MYIIMLEHRWLQSAGDILELEAEKYGKAVSLPCISFFKIRQQEGLVFIVSDASRQGTLNGTLSGHTRYGRVFI